MGERLALGDVFAFIIKSGLGWDLRGKKNENGNGNKSCKEWKLKPVETFEI